ncbi:MAG: hypothetical protein ACFFB3_00085 [Candidatus Hodarchaeota archaeon]
MNRNAFKIGVLLILITIPLFIVLSLHIVDIPINSSSFRDPDEVFSADRARDITIDREGNLVITGFTYAKIFPRSNDPNPKMSDSSEVFLTKLSGTGELIWSTVFGGSQRDEGNGVVADGGNNIIVTGTTRSKDLETLNACDPSFNEGGSNAIDAFIAKFAVNGSLLWSTFLGGADLEHSNSVTVDASNNIIVVGTTYSNNFPVKDAYQSVYNGKSDAFIAKFAPNGSLIWSTYFGESSIDAAADAVVDRQNNIYITGHQDHNILIAKFVENGSLAWSMSITSGELHEDLEQCSIVVNSEGDAIIIGTVACDAFLTKIDGEGNQIWSTHLGGQSEEKGFHVTVDNQDDILVTGVTYSADFPTLNAFDSEYSAEVPTGEAYDNNRAPEDGDAFVSKLSSEGILLWSTFLGGEKFDEGLGIVADGQDNVYVTGFARSYAFPTVNAYDASHNGYSDVFISKFAANGSVIWSTYLGGDIYQPSEGIPFLGWPIGLLTIGILVAGRKRKRKSIHLMV